MDPDLHGSAFIFPLGSGSRREKLNCSCLKSKHSQHSWQKSLVSCLPKHNCSGLVLSTFDVFRPTNLLVFEKYLHTSKNNWGSSLMNYLDPVGPDHCPCGAAAYHRCLLCWARASERIGRAGAHLPGPAAARQPAADRHHGPGSHSRGGERQVLGQLDERPPGNWPAAPLSGPAAQLAASCRHSCQPHSQNKVSRWNPEINAFSF